MAAASFTLQSSFILVLICTTFLVEVSIAGKEGSVRVQDCPKECDRRCSATSHKNNCLLFCNKCCAKCLCVPSGTYGNKQECPCYNNWKTKEGGPKCP